MGSLKYPYAYPIVLTPLKTDIEIDFEMENMKKIILEGVAAYNRATASSRACPKEITDVRCKKRQICFTLNAMEELKSPGRALRTLSLKLIECPEFHNLLTEEGKLFTTTFEEMEEIKMPDKECLESILLKCFTDILFGQTPIMNAAKREIHGIFEKYNLIDKYM